MNPAIVIPTYWSKGKYKEPSEVLSSYDHMTSLGAEGELPRCLKSLVGVGIDCRIILLVVAEPGSELAACEKVRAIARSYKSLDTLVIAQPELALIHARLDSMDMGQLKETAMLSGYGSVRNVGFLVASVFGHDAVVFIDDDEVISDQDFLEKSLYGLGKMTKSGVPILAKTGFFLDRRGSYLTSEKGAWYDHFWRSGQQMFNEWIENAMQGARLVPSNSAFGGCMSMHAEAFKRVAFDPWITRGEDLDYLLNMRMYGLDIWFDNQWSLRHLPPAMPSDVFRFSSDTYRWLYEHRKIEYGRTQIDLLPINTRDLYPYPGPLLEQRYMRTLVNTALLRSIAKRDHSAYWRSAKAVRTEASAYAEENCMRYFQFQYSWPTLISALENDEALAKAILAVRENADAQAVAGSGRRPVERAGEGAMAEEIADRWAAQVRRGAAHGQQEQEDASMQPGEPLDSDQGGQA